MGLKVALAEIAWPSSAPPSFSRLVVKTPASNVKLSPDVPTEAPTRRSNEKASVNAERSKVDINRDEVCSSKEL